MPLDIISTTEEKVHIKLNITTASGKPAKVDGVPTWTLDGTGSVVPDADGLGAFVVSADTPGISTWSVSADADLGPGVTTIVDGGTYTYNDPQASSLGLTADPAVLK